MEKTILELEEKPDFVRVDPDLLITINPLAITNFEFIENKNPRYF